MHRSSFGLPSFVWKLLLALAILALALMRRADASDQPCPPLAPAGRAPQAESWIFRPSRYTHDPDTGGRVAQFAMKPPIEPLDDPRQVTSGYSRTRTVLRGTDGSTDTHYRVQSFGNGRGGLDAEWERFHDAWRGSTVAGGGYQAYPSPYGYPAYGAYGYGGYAGNGYGGYGPAGPGVPAPGPGPGTGYGGVPGFRQNFYGQGYGPGFGVPDAGRLDPDGADGWYEQRRRTPDRQFFTPGLPPRERRPPVNQD